MKLEEKMAYFKDQVTQQSQSEIDQQINQYRLTLEEHRLVHFPNLLDILQNNQFPGGFGDVLIAVFMNK
ncbi:hypothetical protein [Aerococcus urinae]